MTELEKQVRALYRELTKTLIEKEKQITTMESATSGQIASLITDTEGSSAIMKGACITYSNEAKILQGVPEETIQSFGVYSRETARAMAEAARRIYQADLAIGITGTMGNVDPVNADSVPGQVYFALDLQGKVTDYYRELPSQDSRYGYKLLVAKEIVEVLLPLVKAM
ncbi:MAG: nicotinamide-nucleotide amidohydrolase family protein [Lachnospiraceae bacterium]|nr:nicotinamide-nucleotide amidohydrolase family protein [Lachnospiraceae bacterium]